MNLFKNIETTKEEMKEFNEQLNFIRPTHTTIHGLKLLKKRNFSFKYILYVVARFNRETKKESDYFEMSSGLVGKFFNCNSSTFRKIMHRLKETTDIVIDIKQDKVPNCPKKLNFYKVNIEALELELKDILNDEETFNLLTNNVTVIKVWKSFDNFIPFYTLERRKIELVECLESENYKNLPDHEKKKLKAYHERRVDKSKRIIKRAEDNFKKTEEFKQEFPEFIALKEKIDPENHFKFLTEHHQRLTSPYVNTRKTTNPLSDRFDKISEHLGIPKEYIKENDLNGEAFRNAFAIGNGKVLDLSEDIYKTIYDTIEFEEKDLLDTTLKEAKIFTPEKRKVVKNLIMTTFTRPYQVNFRRKRFRDVTRISKKHPILLENFYKAQGMWYEGFTYNDSLDSSFKITGEYFNNYDMKLFEVGKWVEKHLQIKFNRFLTKFTKAVEKFFNWSNNFRYRTLFNAHSSNIQLLVLEVLHEMGIKATTVYDCFYYDRRLLTEEGFNEIYLYAQSRYVEILEENHKKYLSLIRK